MTSIEDEDDIFLHEYHAGIEKNQRYAGTRFSRSGTVPRQSEQYLNEKSVVRTLQKSCPHLRGELNKPQNDPPDVIIQKTNGETIGVEVTELVNEDTIKANIQFYEKRYPADFRYTNFRSPEGIAFFYEKLDYIVKTKAEKLKNIYIANQYEKLILIIDTDEHELKEKLVVRLLENKKWSSSIFDEIYLQLGYESVVGSVGYYPYFRLDA